MNGAVAYLLLALDLVVGAAVIWAVIWVILRLVAKWRASTAAKHRGHDQPLVNTNSDAVAEPAPTQAPRQ